MDFTTMDISTITSGETEDGASILNLFLQEYSKLFGEKVNPGCSKCLQNYINKYQTKMKNTENESGYKLHAKYENIPLEFGSQTFVNNSNITAETGAQLLANNPKGEGLFEKIPAKGAKAEPTIEDKHRDLQDKAMAAENKLNGLAANAAKKNRTAAENALKKANDNLSDFRKENKLIIGDAEEFEYTLTEDDLAGSPELGESGFVAGDVVFAKEVDGKTEVLRKKE